MRAEVPFGKLVPTVRNVRTVYQRVEELADSIALYGLLQNLVVAELPNGTFEVRAGERRRRAIEILQLSAEEQEKRYRRFIGTWPDDKLVPVFIIPEYDAEAVNLIENVQREDLYPWELGRRLAEWNDAGFDQKWIAEKVGKKVLWVGLNMTVGRYLSPKVASAIEKLGKNTITFDKLLKLARMYDRLTLEPDHEAQVAAFESMLGAPRDPKPRWDKKEKVISRLTSLARLHNLPGHAKPYVKAVCDYLLSEEKYARIKFDWK
jgi:ParB family chromosome partitioning protein